MKSKVLLGVLLTFVCVAGCVGVAAARDRDHDGLPDHWESHYGLSTHHRSGGTDGDRDGLNAFREYRLHTDPRRADTDRDGLRDGLEVRRYRTNPRRKDTDGDRYTDGAEVKAGSNPRSKTSIPRGAAGAPGVTTAIGTAGGAGTAPVGAAPGGAAADGSPSTPAGPPTDVGAPPTPPTLRCDRTATTATFRAQFAAASAGEQICLASGNYGTFSGASKPGVVTVGPQAGASVTMSVAFAGASNITLNGITIPDAVLTGATRDIVIRNASMTGTTDIEGLANANVVFDHDSFLNVDANGQFDSPARFHLAYASATPSGVTLQNSLLAGGDSDGVQTGVGVNVLNNEFRDILPSGPNHTDAIQLLGATGAVIRGNYIHRTATGIVGYDGVDHVTIENNVVDLTSGPQRPWAIELYADTGSSIRHNTLRYGSCSYNLACGMITLDRKPDSPAGSGTIIQDNIATEITAQNGSAAATRNHNLLRRNARTGDSLGTPSYVGGAVPSSYAGFLLGASSPGERAASDGRNIGINP